MFNIKISKEHERIKELWENCYTAFNHIDFDGNVFTISGGDYSDDIEFDTYKELISFIEEEVKSALLFFAKEGNLESIGNIILDT